jgi:MFS family permease
MGLRRYRELLRIPGLAALMAAAFIGRLPLGMSVLSLILLLRAHDFDYAAVGVVTAAAGFSVGFSAPVVGRIVDRVGQTKPLVTMAALTTLTGVVLVAAVAASAGVAVAAVFAFVAGASVPPRSASLRIADPLARRGGPRSTTAFALDALLLELVFIVGPLLAATLAAAISPEVGYLTAVALQASGRCGSLRGPSRAAGARRPRESGAARTGALGTPGIRTMVVSLGLTAVALGVLEIAVAAFAEEHATRTTPAGCSRSGASARSPAGSGTAAGTGSGRPISASWPSPACWWPASAPVPLADSMAVFGALLILAGLGLAPSTASAYSLIGALAPAGATTEAYSWQIVGYVMGSAAGAWLAGVVVEHHGVTLALVCAPIAGRDRPRDRARRASQHHGVSTTFPTLRRSAIMRCASAARSNGNAPATTGSIVPSSSSSASGSIHGRNVPECSHSRSMLRPITDFEALICLMRLKRGIRTAALAAVTRFFLSPLITAEAPNAISRDPHAARRRQDQHPLARLQPAVAHERRPGGGVVDRDRRALLERQPLGQRDHVVLRDRHARLVAAEVRPRDHPLAGVGPHARHLRSRPPRVAPARRGRGRPAPSCRRS